MKKNFVFLFFLFVAFFSIAQRGKEGLYTTSSLNEIVNTYTTLTSNVSSNSSSITVADNQLSGAVFSGNLAAGDLILIYQVQGTDIDVNDYPFTAWGSNYTVQTSWFSNGNYTSFIEYGAVLDYKNTGRYEYAEVLSVSGANTINLTCPLRNSYNAGVGAKTQVIRVPRFEHLTILTNTSITTPTWNGQVGGVVALEVEKDLTISGTGKISADTTGFRGGLPDGDGTMAGSIGSISDTNSRGYLGSPIPVEGSEKGESIFGNAATDYANIHSRYGYGSIANGGGGGGYHNAGGGGGSNVGTGAFYGYGVVNRGPGNIYDPAWNLENPALINNPSSGGGRGGYSHAEQSNNPLTTPPHNNSWGQDYRRISGGVGGHPLTYDPTRGFMGGGGGAGHQNNNAGGKGGNGGGVVFINVYGNITGDGTISANGEDGGTSQGATPGLSTAKSGDDGAGGGGGGGAIVLKNVNPLPNTLQLEAKGGNGGNQFIQYGQLQFNRQADGPGGGGAGGMISFSNGTPAQDVSGGNSGTTNENFMATFPVNGATNGAEGMDSLLTEVLDIIVTNDTICDGDTTTILATFVGNSNSSPTLYWYASYHDVNEISTGNSFTTPVLNTTTTYYVGTCDLPYRIPVEIYVAPPILINGTAQINDETCAGNDGQITGLTTTGGVGNYTFEWNGNTSPSEDLTSAVGGNYTLTVTDAAGCTATSGPYTIGASPGPAIDTSNIVYTNESCAGNDGSITGIVVSGGQEPYVFIWNGNPTPNADLTNVPAGSYTLMVHDNNGCNSYVGPFTIQYEGTIVIDDSSMIITDETCVGNDGSIAGIKVSGGIGSLSYSWSPAGGANLDLTGISAGSYTLTVTDQDGCTATSGPYSVNLISQISIQDANAVITDATCGNTNGSITGIQVVGGTAPFTYLWNGNPTSGIDLTNVGVGSYTLTVTDSLGCTVTSGPYTIIEAAGMNIDTTNMVISHLSCSGEKGGISGIIISGGTSPYTYQWNGVSSASPNLSNADAGNYTLVVTDANNCSSSAGPFSIQGAVIPQVFIYTDDQTISEGEIVNIQAAVWPQDAPLQWSPLYGLSCSSCLNPIAGPSTATWYVLTATTGDGCVAKDSVQIIIENPCEDVLFPTIFSPNRDNLNDRFCVIGDCIASMHLTIYNRWGEVIFESTDKNDCWDGTYKNEPLNTGTYTYKFQGEKLDGTFVNKSGNISLIR